jgi:UDP-N-acetylmuramate--alanine ligase
MSGLARLAVAAGYVVSGTDREESAALGALRALGVTAHAGHTAEAVGPDVAAVVVSTAIAADAPDIAEARRRGLPIIHRADLLAELMSTHRGLAVAGAHGKSTTSAMLRLALGGASACIGATIPEGSGTGAAWGPGPWFVAEADESDKSLLKLAPEAAILLNIDHDHHSTYARIEDVEDVFAAFIARLPTRGALVVGPEPRARRIAAAAPCRVITVGDAETDDLRIVGRDSGGMHLRAADGQETVARLRVPGAHNAGNAACAIALAVWCGEALDAAAARVATFEGVGRRFELRGEVAGIRVVDDYAHHPVELAATLAAAREQHSGRIVAIFQPHLFSRTRALGDEFGAALGAADVAIVTDIYAAREPDDPTVTARLVVDAVPVGTHAIYAPLLADALAAALAEVRSGDLVLTLGAGDITTLGQELVVALEYQYKDGARSHGLPHAT